MRGYWKWNKFVESGILRADRYVIEKMVLQGTQGVSDILDAGSGGFLRRSMKKLDVINRT